MRSNRHANHPATRRGTQSRAATARGHALAKPAKKASKSATKVQGTAKAAARKVSKKKVKAKALPPASGKARERGAAPRPVEGAPPAPTRSKKLETSAPWMGAFEKAMAAFQAERWNDALGQLRALQKSYPNEAVLLDRVRAYTRICERRVEPARAEPRSGEEHYQMGVLRLNAGAAEEALSAFEMASTLDRQSDKAFYGAAVAHAQRRSRESALSSLRQAIELNAENRIYAQNDSDLESLRDDPEFQELVGIRRTEADVSDDAE